MRSVGALHTSVAVNQSQGRSTVSSDTLALKHWMWQVADQPEQEPKRLPWENNGKGEHAVLETQ